MTLQFGHSDSVISIDLDRIAANWCALDALSAERTKTAAVIKANAYGMGAGVIGPRLAAAGCSLFFVMSAHEGVVLRSALTQAGHNSCGIFCLAGPQLGQEQTFLDYALMPVINDTTQLARVSMMARKAGITIPSALHIDTGMSRLGLSDSDLDWLVEQMSEDKTLLDGIDLRFIMSHLTSSEAPKDSINNDQWHAFNAAHGYFPGVRASLANSGGILLGKKFHFDMTRPGIALYGQDPSGTTTPPSGLEEAIRWDARILQIRNEKEGNRVGYNGTHILERDAVILSAAIGYADGYPRNLGDKAMVEIDGFSAPVIGRISMDIITIDVTDVPSDILRKATSVCVLGDHYPLARMAADAGTIGYEILTQLGQRPHRHYISHSGNATHSFPNASPNSS